MILPVKAIPAQDNPKYSEWLIKKSPAKSIREDVFKYHKDLYWNKYRHIMEAEDRALITMFFNEGKETDKAPISESDEKLIREGSNFQNWLRILLSKSNAEAIFNDIYLFSHSIAELKLTYPELDIEYEYDSIMKVKEHTKNSNKAWKSFDSFRELAMVSKKKKLTYKIRLYKAGKDEDDLQQATEFKRWKILRFLKGNLLELTWEDEKTMKGFIELWEKEAKARAASIKIGEDHREETHE